VSCLALGATSRRASWLAAGALTIAACRTAPRGLDQTRVPVPAGADSAWAVGVAARQLGLDAAGRPYAVLRHVPHQRSEENTWV
jgi:hypothetical protein